MKRRIPWIDMFVFYLLLPFMLVEFVEKMGKALGNTFHETWDEMVDLMIRAQSSR